MIHLLDMGLAFGCGVPQSGNEDRMTSSFSSCDIAERSEWSRHAYFENQVWCGCSGGRPLDLLRVRHNS